MVSNVVCTCLVRCVLPLVLAASVAFRQNGMSLIYLFLLLCVPLVPAPTRNSMTGSTGRFLKAVLTFSFLNVIAQITFQIVLLSLQPYGHFLHKCQFLERLLRHIGLVRLDHIKPEDGIRLLGSDAVMMGLSVVVWVICSKLCDGPVFTSVSSPSTADAQLPTIIDDKNSGTKKSIFSAVGKHIALASLGLAGAMQPSVPNAIYFLCFLGGATWWACYKELGKVFGWVCRTCMIFAGFHLLALFLYQLQWAQELIPADNLFARLFGLTALWTTSCGDPRSIHMAPLEWASFVNPLAILWLYYILAFAAQSLISTSVVCRAISGTVDEKTDSANLSTFSETSPLVSTRKRTKSYHSVTPRTTEGNTLEMDPTGSLIWSSPPAETQEESFNMQPLPSTEEDGGPQEDSGGGWEVLLEPVIYVFQLIVRSSYIATNIIMMAWSITYHSWLTFVLLLWACILWMVPNQRVVMLRCSPGLVLYAEFLLLGQYICGLDLKEDELPQTIESVNLSQMGFVRYPHLPCLPLLVKSLYTIMFWITLRQYMQESWEEKNFSALEGMAAEPYSITVSTVGSQGQTTSQLSHGVQNESDGIDEVSPFMQKLGVWLKGVLTKFWIWVVAIMLFVIGLGGAEVVLYRIVYMALFLIFVVTFQLSYRIWQKMMYGFWLTVIIYSMLVLVLIYTYQFDNFPEYYSYAGIPVQLQHDIGLEVYDTGALFVRLLTPTFFVVITIIQLHYFHKDFLAISNIDKVPSVSNVETGTEDSPIAGESADQQALITDCSTTESTAAKEKEATETEKPSLLENFSAENLKKFLQYYGRRVYEQGSTYLVLMMELGWRFLEIHIIKIVMFSTFLLSVYNVCAVHFIFCLSATLALPFSVRVQTGISHFCSVLAALLLISKMIYQIDYINQDQFNVNCTKDNNSGNPLAGKTVNDVIWFGFQKTDNLPNLLKGYIGLILVLTIQAVVKIRQKCHWQMKGVPEPEPGILFPEITREDADRGVLEFIQFMFNYGFYKFGVEICLMSTVAVIGTRLDFYSLIYSLWLSPMFLLSRCKLAKVWFFFVAFMAVFLPFQYIICVGIPRSLCINYPWDIERELIEWLYLPDFVKPPEAYKLVTDFILLLFACLQRHVFHREMDPDVEYQKGGSNKELIWSTCDTAKNPVPDYITYVRTWLDFFKSSGLSSFYWMTLAIVFLTGTNRVNLFAIGYLVGSFIFLWQGNEFYLQPRKKILRWWNCLLTYNVLVIFLKSVLQLLGCVYLVALQYNFCWFIQLFGIACIKKFSGKSSAAIAAVIENCPVPHDEAGLVWDGICFGFLLMQRRLFSSYYFLHLVREIRAQTILASRGAELIEELMQREIKEQQEEQQRVLEKLKEKMERIKEQHQKLQQPQDHYEAIRSGDYYMFEEYDDMQLDATHEDKTLKDKEKPQDGVTVSELLSTAMKTGDVEQAADIAITAGRGPPPEESMTTSELSGTAEQAGKRLSMKSDQSAKSLQPGGPTSSLSVVSPGQDPSGMSTLSQQEPLPEETEEEVNLLKKIWGWLKFAWAFVRSMMVSATCYLNKFSKDYRYVSQRLKEEKELLKEKGFDTSCIPAPSTKWHPSRVTLPPTKLQREPPEAMQVLIERASEDRELDTDDSNIQSPTQEETELGPGPATISTDDQELQKGSPILRLIVAIWYALVSHSEIVCYFMIFLNQLKSASILSLPLPLMVFLWGTLSVPRPTRTFWVTVIGYTEAVVIIKCLFQFELFPWNQEAKLHEPFWAPRILGIEKKEKYAVYDLSLLLVVFFHRFMLKSLGLWKNTEHQVSQSDLSQPSNVTVETPGSPSHLSEHTTQTTQSLPFPHSAERTTSIISPDQELQPHHQFKAKMQNMLKTGPDELKLVAHQYMSSVKQFIQQLLNPSYSVSVDIYAYMFMCDFFNFFVIIFGFASFGTQQGDGGVSSYLEDNKVPIPFLVMLILQFALIIIDRALFLRKFILGKLIFQVMLILGVHLWMFFVLPAVTEREFNAALPPQMWYMVKCIYLLLSAYQIRSGYPTRILGNFVCKKYNYLNMFLFKGFMTVPFLFELRTLMDWIWTDTSMTLSDWLKLEDIFAHIFQLKCQRRAEAEYPQGRGEKKKPIIKYGVGGMFLFFIIAIIWFPLVLFALGNTVGIPNPPNDVSIEISFGAYQPVFKMTVQKNSLFTFSQMDWNLFNYHYRSDRVAQTFLANYDKTDVVVAKMSGSSTAVWGISPPAQEKMMEELKSNNTVKVKLLWTISRISNSVDVAGEVTDERQVDLPAYIPSLSDKGRMKRNPVRETLIQMLNKTDGNVTIEKIFPKFIKVLNRGKASVVNQLSGGKEEEGYQDLILSLKNSGNNVQEWWEVREDSSSKKWSWLPYSDYRFLNLYTFNDKAFPPTLSFLSGGGIIGLYTTFVLVASRFIRGFFTGIAFTIMFDDLPYVDRILQLCLDIYLVRESRELHLEEDLFAKLIFLYRSPETLIKWSRPRDEET